MGLRERLAKRWGAGLLEEAKNEALEETIEQIKGRAHRLTWANPELAAELVEATDFGGGYGGSVDADDWMYRSLTGYWSARDLPPQSHDQALMVAYTLWQRNPLGKRISELNADYVVGDGVTLSFSNSEVEDLVQEFWTDDDNRMDERLPTFALEYGLFGELIPEALVGDVSGVVKLGYIDPIQIAQIHCLNADSNDTRNVLIDDVVQLKRRVGEEQGRKLNVIRVRESGRLEGDVFLFKANALSNDPRGWPDMLSIADWLDNYDQLLWDMLERHRLMQSFIYDVTVKGGPREIQEQINANKQAPKAGTVRVHNDSITWAAVSPTLGSKENEIEADVIKEHLAGGAGIPKTWMSATADVNRATAQELGTPAVRRLAARQKRFLSSIERMLRYVLEQAEEAGRLKTDSNGMVQVNDENGEPAKMPDGSNRMAKPWDCVKLQGPETSVKDMTAAGQMLASIVPALQIAEDSGWVGRRPVRQIMSHALAFFGFEYDPSMDLEADEALKAAAQGAEVQPGHPEPASRAALDAAAATAGGGR